MATRQKVRELGPSDFEGRPATDEELAAWSTATPEQQALFGGEMTPTFRWLLDQQGEDFPLWLELAGEIGEAIKQPIRGEKPMTARSEAYESIAGEARKGWYDEPAGAVVEVKRPIPRADGKSHGYWWFCRPGELVLWMWYGTPGWGDFTGADEPKADRAPDLEITFDRAQVERLFELATSRGAVCVVGTDPTYCWLPPFREREQRLAKRVLEG